MSPMSVGTAREASSISMSWNLTQASMKLANISTSDQADQRCDEAEARREPLTEQVGEAAQQLRHAQPEQQAVEGHEKLELAHPSPSSSDPMT
jgi:hypothetical protein